MRDDDEAKDPDLERVIAALSDGDRVDWGAETTRRPDLRPLLDELRVMEAVAAMHGGEPEAGTGPRVERWGHLKVLERIGRGTFGDVYRAFDPRLEIEVALKLIREGSGLETHILHEARRLARVRHDNVLAVHGADRHGGRAGLWTDLIAGRTLEELLQANGPLGAGEAVRIGLDLCRALAAVHAAGVVHRDVKTPNVMRERGGRIVLMDFGAGIELDADATGDLPEDGTPFCMAPEELRGEPPTPASDLYSLGVLLFRMVTDRFPVEASTYDELKALHARGEHTQLRDLRPDLPSSFIRIVERALETSPERRFRTAGEFERALLGSGRVILPEPNPPPRPGPIRRRARWTAGGMVIVAIAWLAIAQPWKPSDPSTPPGPSATGDADPGPGAATESEAGAPNRDGGPREVTDAGGSRAQPAPVGAVRTGPPLVASATMLHVRGEREQALAPGESVAPGDALALRFQAGEPVHVYVLNEDATGAVYVLFPGYGTELSNPLAAGDVHRLPGLRAGRDVSWQVTSAGGRETIVLIATREPSAYLEREIARLPSASRDRPVERAEAASPGSRGVGGMVEGPASAPSTSRPRIAALLRGLAAETGRGAPWIWQIELENPR